MTLDEAVNHTMEAYEEAKFHRDIPMVMFVWGKKPGGGTLNSYYQPLGFPEKEEHETQDPAKEEHEARDKARDTVIGMAVTAAHTRLHVHYVTMFCEGWAVTELRGVEPRLDPQNFSLAIVTGQDLKGQVATRCASILDRNPIVVGPWTTARSAGADPMRWTRLFVDIYQKALVEFAVRAN